MKEEKINSRELHYLNSLFVCQLNEVADNIQNMDEILFHKMKEEISKVIDEKLFEEIFVPIDEYARALADISHIAGMKFMLHLLSCLER